jgi:hypothetical protein
MEKNMESCTHELPGSGVRQKEKEENEASKTSKTKNIDFTK